MTRNSNSLRRSQESIRFGNRNHPVDIFRLPTVAVGGGQNTNQLFFEPLIREFLKLRATRSDCDSIGGLVLDPHGDIRPMLSAELEKAGRKDDLLVLGTENWVCNPFHGIPAPRISGLIAHFTQDIPVKERGYFTDRFRYKLAALVEIKRSAGRPIGPFQLREYLEAFSGGLKFPHLASIANDPTAAEMFASTLPVPDVSKSFEKGSIILLDGRGFKDADAFWFIASLLADNFFCKSLERIGAGKDFRRSLFICPEFEKTKLLDFADTAGPFSRTRQTGVLALLSIASLDNPPVSTEPSLLIPFFLSHANSCWFRTGDTLVNDSFLNWCGDRRPPLPRWRGEPFPLLFLRQQPQTKLFGIIPRCGFAEFLFRQTFSYPKESYSCLQRLRHSLVS